MGGFPHYGLVKQDFVDQGMLRWTQETCSHFEKVSFGAYQEEGPRGDQAQVHRHQLQDGTWSFPNQKGQNGLYGTSQKGYRQGRSSCLICFLNMLCLENTEFI